MKLLQTVFVLFLFWNPHLSRAQGDLLDPLGSAFRIEKRKELIGKMDRGSVVVLFSGGHQYLEEGSPFPLPFQAAPSFRYLTGLNLPRAVLVLAPVNMPLGTVSSRRILFFPDSDLDPFHSFGDAPGFTSKFVSDSLFLAPLSQWEKFCTEFLGGAEVRKIYSEELPSYVFEGPLSTLNQGWKECAPLYRVAGPGYPFKKSLQKLFSEISLAGESSVSALVDKINGHLLYFPEAAGDPILREAALMRNGEDLKKLQEKLRSQKVDLVGMESWVGQMRSKKSVDELVWVRQAGLAAAESLKQAIISYQGGKPRFTLAGLMGYVSGAMGASSVPSLKIAGNKEASYFLYRNLDGELPKSGPVILALAVSCEGYHAGVSRTIPASGTFSPEEGKVAELVRGVHANLLAGCKAGVDVTILTEKAIASLEKGLVDKGLVPTLADAKKATRLASIQGCGLEYIEPISTSLLEKNQVLLVQTGLYFSGKKGAPAALEGKGFEWVDLIRIGEGSAEVLTSGVPNSLTEIQELMNQKSPFESWSPAGQ